MLDDLRRRRLTKRVELQFQLLPPRQEIMADSLHLTVEVSSSASTPNLTVGAPKVGRLHSQLQHNVVSGLDSNRMVIGTKQFQRDDLIEGIDDTILFL